MIDFLGVNKDISDVGWVCNCVGLPLGWNVGWGCTFELGEAFQVSVGASSSSKT